MSRNRARKKQPVQLVRTGQRQEHEHAPYQRGYRAGEPEYPPPGLIPLDDEIRPILEANARTRQSRAERARNGMRSISQAWDDTEALGITADMRRSGPGMLSDQDRKDTLYKAYLNSVWISACVDVISKRITSGGYTIEYCGANETPTPEEEAQKEQLQAFIEFTNDDEDFLQLVRTIVADILIYGECFVEIVKQNGIPYSLHKIDCITMNYTLDPHGNIVKFIQNLYHSTETIEFAPDEVMRFWLPSPNANKIALSPIERIMGSIDADVHMSDWVRSFFRKGARPNFWIKFDGPKEEADRFVAWLRENYTGMANAHVPLILYDGAELYEIGKGSVDIDFLKGRELMCKEILAGYQVPPALVGLIESGNIGGGTGESQEKSFLRNSCDPMRAMVMGQVNYRIVQKGFGITCWRIGTRYADYREEGSVSIIRDRDIRNGSLNINEVRRDMNRPQIDGGDVNVIVTTREIQPLDRLDDLSEEQAAQAQATTAHVQAQATLAQAQADKLKEPPPEPTPPPVPAPVPPAGPTPDDQAASQERAELTHSIDALIERLDTKQRSEDVQAEAEAMLIDLLNRYRQSLPEHVRETTETRPEPDTEQALSRISTVLEGVDEQMRELRAQLPRKRSRKKSTDASPEESPMVSQQGTCTCETCRSRHGQHIADGQMPPYHEGCDCQAVPQGTEHPPQQAHEASAPQQHTGVMVAFMLDLETAEQLAIPGGEPVNDLHVTLAYLGDSSKVTLNYGVIKDALARFAAQSSPLQGHTGGLGRFTPSDSSDGKSPVIALINVPGLQAWRTKLVQCLEDVAVNIAKDFDYTAHCTLAYIDADAPMPLETIPELPLTFNALCLAVGDERFSYPFGGDPNVTQSQQNAEALPHDESRSEPAPARISDDTSREATPDPAHDAQDGGDQRTVIVDELARWRERALEDVLAWQERDPEREELSVASSLRGFTTTVIPEQTHQWISSRLAGCENAEDVHQIFEQASAQGLSLEEHAYPHDKIVLQQHIHEVFNNVAERGHKALSEESE